MIIAFGNSTYFLFPLIYIYIFKHLSFWSMFMCAFSWPNTDEANPTENEAPVCNGVTQDAGEF